MPLCAVHTLSQMPEVRGLSYSSLEIYPRGKPQ